MEKTVREAKADTGKNECSTSITDGYAHTATGSAGDTMEYQIVSTLPTITSQATALSTYNFYDTLCEGLTYSKDAGVTITNLWGTLHYKVVETRIIQPNDIDAIKIQPGRDLITLLTCHPYASGGRQRFLVICERMEEENGR